MDLISKQGESELEFQFKSKLISLEMIRQQIQSNEYHEQNPRNLILDLVHYVEKISMHFRNRTDQDSPIGLTNWSEAHLKSLEEAFNGTLTSLIRLADSCQIDLARATIEKMTKNEGKYPIQKSYGLAKKYNQL